MKYHIRKSVSKETLSNSLSIFIYALSFTISSSEIWTRFHSYRIYYLIRSFFDPFLNCTSYILSISFHASSMVCTLPFFISSIASSSLSDDYDVDGRQKSRYVDRWTSDNIEHDDLVDVYGTETVRIEGIDRAKSLGTYVTDEDGNEFIPPSDEFEYGNNYNDALHEFYETKEWKEPERPKCPVGWPDEEYGYEQYCPTRIYRGEIETPYGKGILCSAVYEGVRYTGYDAEMHCYTEIADTYLWSRDEEMILEVDDRFVIISYSYFEWSDLGANVESSDLDYTGRLDEIIPQMF